MTDKATLAGKTALVTGAGRGIGAGIALAFAKAGADLILAARSRPQLDEIKAGIEAAGRSARIAQVDLSKSEEVARLVRDASDADILINNAAVGQRFLRCTQWPEDYWREAFEVGFWAPAILMRDIGGAMANRGSGVIINISSVAGLRARPFLAHYSAIKAASDMVMRTTAMELGRFGVRALSIAPGAIETGHHGITDPRATGSPINRIGLPRDIGELAVFLASDAASFITGDVIACDGGTSAGEYGRYEAYLAAVEDMPDYSLPQ